VAIARPLYDLVKKKTEVRIDKKKQKGRMEVNVLDYAIEGED